jgi:hypothetical protein
MMEIEGERNQYNHPEQLHNLLIILSQIAYTQISTMYCASTIHCSVLMVLIHQRVSGEKLDTTN